MTDRKHNFCAGPCTLPLSVLESVQSELVDYHGAGMSLIEMSHRSAEYDEVHQRARSLALEVYEAPDDFDVLFIQGGATLQFAMVPMNLLRSDQQAGYANTGSWATGAINDGKYYGALYTVWDGKEEGFVRAPRGDEFEVRENTRYVHITSNETIGGVRYPEFPELEVPLVADVSSELMARPLPWDRFDMVYGGVQKNLGPSGMALVFVRKSILADTNRDIARYLRYDVHQDKESLFNTPPMFVVAVVEKVLDWMKSRGGLASVERDAAEKAKLLYDVIDGSGGYFRCPVDVASRSHMNVVFRLPSDELEKKFLVDAERADLLNLKGHRSVGGCRASIYNAMPRESVEVLAGFMVDFLRANG